MRIRDFIKPIVLFIGLTCAFLLWRFTPLGNYVSLENANALARWAKSLGPMAPVLYLAFYGLGTVVLIPGSVLSAVGGLSFGVYLGTALVSFGSTLGASCAFLVARYLARPTVEKIVKNRPLFKKIDDGVTQHGWRMVAVTRLVPIFPYMFINYALGLTNIRFGTYVLVTFLGMLPANFALCLAAGSIVSGGDDWKKIFIYLFIAGTLFSLLAILPVILKKRLPLDLGDTLGSDLEH